MGAQHYQRYSREKFNSWLRNNWAWFARVSEWEAEVCLIKMSGSNNAIWSNSRQSSSHHRPASNMNFFFMTTKGLGNYSSGPWSLWHWINILKVLILIFNSVDNLNKISGWECIIFSCWSNHPTMNLLRLNIKRSSITDPASAECGKIVKQWW